MKQQRHQRHTGTERTDETHVTHETQVNDETEILREKENENLSAGETNATDESDEAPPLATRVASLPEAVQLALSLGVGEECLFIFARALRAFTVTTKLKLTREDNEQAFELWWAAAQSALPADADRDEYRFLFLDAVARAKTPLGASPLQEAIARAETRPTPIEANRYPSPRLKRLVAVCYHLQILQGNAAIFLGLRDVQTILGSGTLAFASRMMDGLVHDGVLELVEKGKPGGRRRASRYRFKFDPSRTATNNNLPGNP